MGQKFDSEGRFSCPVWTSDNNNLFFYFFGHGISNVQIIITVCKKQSHLTNYKQ